MKMRTINEAAGELGITRHRLNSGIRDGRYPSMQWGSRKLVDVDALRPIVEAEKTREGMVRIQECADLIGVSATTLRNMLHKGIVPYERRGQYFYFDVDAVKEALRQRMTNQPQK